MTAVYWLLDDTDELLYVGMTDNLPQRIDDHAKRQPWWSDVTAVAHTDEMPRTEARAVEAEDIWTLAPRHNVSGQAPVLTPLDDEYVALLDFFSTATSSRRLTILAAAQAVVDGAEGTPDGVLVPLHLLDQLAEAVDRADAEAEAS